MNTARIRNDEIVGLGVAAILHVALLGALLFQPDPAAIPEIEPITVSLADDIGLEATAPVPIPESRAAMAPELSELPEPAAQLVTSAPLPQPEPASQPARSERAAARGESPDRRDRRRPDREQAQPAPRQTQGRTSQISDNFLSGTGSSRDTNETGAPAATFGPAEQAALRSAINRQLRPHWRAPQGVDTDRLVTILRFRLREDGSLAGRPTIVRQSGINDANRAQAGVHAERAIRAVQLAAPFRLPEEFYDKWKYISEWRFDRRL